MLFGAVMLSAVIITESVQAQTFTTLHSFDGTDGGEPKSPLIQATNGDLYGATARDGANGDSRLTIAGQTKPLRQWHSLASFNWIGLE